MKIVLLVLLIGSLAAQAQSVPKVEIGIGYSYARMPVPLATKSVNNHALAIDTTAYLNRHVGITGEFDAYYHCVAGCLPYNDIARNNSFVFLAGPKLRLGKGRIVPWVHALGGYANMRFSEELGAKASWNGAAAAVGGGLDIVGHRFGVRVGQIDYFRTPGPLSNNNLRVTTGFLINLGTRVK
jgi:hypothetical protein